MLALATGNSVYLNSTEAHIGCDRSAEDDYSSMAPDLTFTFVGGGLCVPAVDFVFAFWIMITFTIQHYFVCTGYFVGDGFISVLSPDLPYMYRLQRFRS
jgi:hypothetical protein